MNIPTSRTAELGLIGCALRDPQIACDIAASVPRSALFSDDTGRAFEVIAAMVTDGTEVDPVTLARAWQRQHGTAVPGEILAAPDAVPSAHQWPAYRDEVVDAQKRRDAIGAAQKAIGRAADPTRDIAQTTAELAAELDGQVAQGATLIDGRGAARAFLADSERRYDLQGRPSGIVTGFRQFDAMTGGLQLGEATYFAARPSIGKTAIIADAVRRACFLDGVPTLFCTYEMSPEALLRRMFCAEWGVPLSAFRTGQLTPDHFAAINRFAVSLKKRPIYFENCLGGVNVAHLSGKIAAAVRRHGVKLVAVDYLQKIPPAQAHEKRTYEVGSVSNTLKAIADRHKIALLAAAQLSREPDKDKGREPRLSDLADSAQLERDGDLIALLTRNRGENPTEAGLIIAKQRDGELGKVSLRFNPQFCRFENP